MTTELNDVSTQKDSPGMERSRRQFADAHTMKSSGSILGISRVMRKVIIAIIIFLAGGASAEVKALRNLDIGDPCPSFCAPQTDGTQLCSSTFENSILVTSFVRMDQKESLKVLLALQDLHDRYRTKNVFIIGILSGEIDRQELLDFAGRNRLTLPLVLDGNREIYGSFGVFVYPTLAVFGQDGKLSYLFGSNTINIGKRVEGCIRYLSAEIDAGELEKILHPVVEKTDPDNAKASRYYNLARKSFDKQHFSKAKKILEASLEKYPKHAQSHALYGSILMQEEDCPLGLKQFELALEIDPDLEEAKTGKQLCLEKLKR